MSDWKLAMICLLPLVLSPAKLRTWGALLGASLAAMFVPFLGAFVAIDLIAAALVLKHPTNCAMRAIGALFVGMVFFELGFLFSSGNQNELLMASLQVMGWMQFAILLSWGLYDTIRFVIRRAGPDRSAVLGWARD